MVEREFGININVYDVFFSFLSSVLRGLVTARRIHKTCFDFRVLGNRQARPGVFYRRLSFKATIIPTWVRFLWECLTDVIGWRDVETCFVTKTFLY